VFWTVLGSVYTKGTNYRRESRTTNETKDVFEVYKNI